ncbi:MAG: heme-binding protein [Candidatus Thiodiazotropha sp.]
MLSRSFYLLTVLSIFSTNSACTDSEQDNSVYRFRSISLEMASKAAWGAINDCRKRGYSVAAAVVDRGGNLQTQLRDRFAGPHTVETAYRKAWTANSFRQSTAELAGMLEERRIPNQVVNNPGALLVGGGLTIEAGGEILGGIGISGAPPGKSERDSIDGACALAGLEVIREALEFAE